MKPDFFVAIVNVKHVQWKDKFIVTDKKNFEQTF